MRVREISTDAKTGKVSERWIDLAGVVTEEEAREKEVVQRIDDAREERSRRLAESDWSTKPDVPMDDERRNAWLAYRQSLRDVPSQAGFPDAIEWPAKPDR